MIRLIMTLCLAAAALTQVARADELDFPTNPDWSYSVTDVSQFACLRDRSVRIVYVEYYSAAGEPPCAVVYEKSPPEASSRETLWKSSSQRGFCQAQAGKLVQRLRNGGWRCGLYRDVYGIGN
jgi:hypothetical protein